MKTPRLICLLSLCLLGACSALRPSAPPPSGQVLKEAAHTTGSLFAWNPTTTVAVINPAGEYCIATADVFDPAKTGVAISDRRLGLEFDEVSQDKATQIKHKDTVVTFLGVALMNICVLSANHRLANTQVSDLVKFAITTAATLPRNQPPEVNKALTQR